MFQQKKERDRKREKKLFNCNNNDNKLYFIDIGFSEIDEMILAR